jgi:hypothetical protein
MPAERKYSINSKQAKVLAAEPDGNPIFLQCSYGKGVIYLLTFPLEMDLMKLQGSFDKGQPDFNSIYKKIAAPLIAGRAIRQNNSSIGITEHEISASEKVVVLINYNPQSVQTPFEIKPGWKITGSLHGKAPGSNILNIGGNDALVLMLKK